MLLQSLDDFLAQNPVRGNAYVKERGFRSLYVRVGPRYIAGTLYPKVLDIARAEVIRKGRGRFTALINRLHEQGYTLYIESVLNERLVPKLLSMGFTQLPSDGAPSFYLLHQSNPSGQLR